MDSDLPQRMADIIDLGCLVSIGTTRDGGALAITILHDGEWRREYFRTAEEAVSWLQEARGALTADGLTPRNGVSDLHQSLSSRVRVKR
jgi:hypothetical protein